MSYQAYHAICGEMEACRREEWFCGMVNTILTGSSLKLYWWCITQTNGQSLGYLFWYLCYYSSTHHYIESLCYLLSLSHEIVLWPLSVTCFTISWSDPRQSCLEMVSLGQRLHLVITCTLWTQDNTLLLAYIPSSWAPAPHLTSHVMRENECEPKVPHVKSILS